MSEIAYLQGTPCAAFDHFDDEMMAHIIEDEGLRCAVQSVLTARYACQEVEDSFGAMNFPKAYEALRKATDALHAYCYEQWRAGW